MAPNSKDIQVKSISTNSFYSSSTRRSVSSIRKKLNGGNSASVCLNNYNNSEFNNYNDNFNDKKNINPSRKRSFNSSYYSNSYDRLRTNQSNYSSSLNRSKSINKNEYCYNKKISPLNRSPSKGSTELTRQLIVAKKKRLFTGEKTSFSPPLKKYFVKENDLTKIQMKKTSSSEDFCKNLNSPDQKKTDNSNLIDKNNKIKNTTVDEEILDIPLERTETLFKSEKNAYFIKPVTIEEVRIEENKENSLSNKIKKINSLNQISDKTKSLEDLDKNTEELSPGKTELSTMTNEDDKKEQSLYNESRVENLYPVALRNLGNTCYMNSIVQSLFNLPFLMCELRDSMEKGFVLNKNFNFSMTKSLIELFEEYKRIKKSQSQNDEELERRLCAFKYNVGLHSAEFKSSGQHDAVEFLDSVINAIDEEFDKVKKTVSSFINPITKVFKIELGEATICEKCKSKTNIVKNKQHCLILSLPEEKYMENNTNLSLQNILCNYFKPEKRESKCPKCSCSERSRLLSVVKSPKILILQLGRYSATGEKRHESIKVPHEILLPQIIRSKEEKSIVMSPSKSKNLNKNDQFNKENNFQLSGVICHHGSCMAGGHYICYVHDRLNNEWYQCDDENIVRTTFERVQEGSKSSGYCFFYLNKKYT